MSIAPVTSDIAVSDCRENAHSYNSDDCARKTHIAMLTAVSDCRENAHSHNSDDCARKTHVPILTPVISAKVVGL